MSPYSCGLCATNIKGITQNFLLYCIYISVCKIIGDPPALEFLLRGFCRKRLGLLLSSGKLQENTKVAGVLAGKTELSMVTFREFLWRNKRKLSDASPGSWRNVVGNIAGTFVGEKKKTFKNVQKILQESTCKLAEILFVNTRQTKLQGARQI